MLLPGPRRCYNYGNTAAIVQWQNAALWQRMSWVRNPLAAPKISSSQAVERGRVASTNTTPPALFVGTSGWAYPTWKPGFYPAKTPATKFLGYYASRLTSVEVNYTFRTLPTAKMLDGWLAATPDTFRFSFKAPQRITHFSRLRDCEALVHQFVEALAPAREANQLGLLLFQLPPNFQATDEHRARLATFLAHPDLSTTRIAFEFRHESWFAEDVYAVLRDHNAALCIAASDDLATPEVHTACTHTCFRLRRNGGYTQPEIESLAERLTALTKDREVFAYFKHEDEPTGALNAAAFLEAAASNLSQPQNPVILSEGAAEAEGPASSPTTATKAKKR
jgi:uncharacterized protein YecE (DUF72 family)